MPFLHTTLRTAGLFLLAGSALFASESTSSRLEPTKDMAAQTRWVVNTINARHYLRDSIQDLDGKEIIEAYVESFDYSKMYFTREEIDDFVFRFADATEGFLAKGNLYAAFEIYEDYKEAARARTEWIEALLESDDLSFDLNDSFSPNRREANWPADKAEADDLWTRRIKFQILNELLSLASELEEDDSDGGLNPNNPDIVESSTDDSFDPSKIERLLEDKDFYNETLDEAKSVIQRRFQRNLTLTQDREAAEVQEVFINAMTHLFDPHSTFLSSDTLESFNSSVQNSFVGIGALLEDDDGICTIKDILPGGPAEESGLLSPNDQILGVAQGKDGAFEDVVDMQLRYIVRKIKGKKDTIVRLLIRPGDAADPSVRKDISIVRGEVKLTANLATGKLITVPTETGETVAVGVIELPSFYGNIGGGSLTTTSGDVSELIEKLGAAGAEGLILDLRMNGGGLLSEAVRVAGLFIPVGPVVQVRDKDEQTDILSDRDPTVMWNGPLIVLTSRFSASASEIVAGALQDHGRALIVGNTSTHGKGTVQEVYHMNPRPAFSWFNTTAPQTKPVASKITIKQFYLPGGSSTQVRGVPSDIALPSVNEFLPIGESDLPHALPWDQISEVEWVNDWSKLKIASPEDPGLKDALLSASEQRQGSLEEFDFLKRQIEWRRKRYDEKDISLNLAERINTKIREQAYIEELDATYEALQENDFAAEEILLDVAKEQEAISKANIEKAEENGNDQLAEADEDDEADLPPFDIYLREGARIMSDWILIESSKRTASR
ncbi:carboxy terminal-processing peptidase [Coraliomargarita akajimensis]|uniref:Carboxyl-terminal protease n=1 Tax=Coraliomargarita akajimensis (strain DSM 45221 / IAM 15411 / JCM 23193 / KCTC 12865 / 04OKA010-24) TaxID=583355 RepID=D5ELK2_CORAD|nr:carboxy terminal-processing peptidase [Coraliomargarita akajimensis]ADE55138.1 carboxyl-terminal protease [Coraliomargarita akajimensis DSM 45221]